MPKKQTVLRSPFDTPEDRAAFLKELRRIAEEFKKLASNEEQAR